MSLSIRTNIPAMSVKRILEVGQRDVNKSIERLASGLRIVEAADDIGGMAMSSKLRADVRSMSQAERNANDGVAMTQTAEGTLNVVSGLLIELRELALASANGTLTIAERGVVHDEFTDIRDEIDRLAAVVEFNDHYLLDGSDSSIVLQVGIHSTVNDQITVQLTEATASQLAGGFEIASVSTVAEATSTLSLLDTAIDQVASIRGDFGAAQNRLTAAIDALALNRETLTAAESRIRDVDIAAETTNLTRGQIIMSAGIAVLSQANSIPGMMLDLLG